VPIERTFAIIKPDGSLLVAIHGEILALIQQVASPSSPKSMRLRKKKPAAFTLSTKRAPFFGGTDRVMSSGKIIAMVLEAEGAS